MEKKTRRKKRILSLYNDVQYVFTANMTRRRFWMLNSLMPKTSDGFGLKKAIEHAFQDGRKIMDFGCGDTAQSLVDLRNDGFTNLYGIDLRPPKSIGGIEVIKADILNTGLPDGFIDGVLYSSYVLQHLTPEGQHAALEEMDRITSIGARGFVGPFIPKYLLKTPFAEKYRGYENPLVGFVEEKNKEGKGKWALYKSPLFTSNIKSSKLDEFYYRSTVPIFSIYVLTGRSVIRKFIPNIRVKKDSKVRFPFEYFITFSKI